MNPTNITDAFIREVFVRYATTVKPKTPLITPDQVVRLIRQFLPDNSREHFLALFLDGANHLASYSVVSSGVANKALVHPREIFQRAVLAGAVSIIVAHNHPSGSTKPSSADIDITKRLKECGELLGINVLDHLIVTDAAYVSLHESGDM